MLTEEPDEHVVMKSLIMEKGLAFIGQKLNDGTDLFERRWRQHFGVSLDVSVVIWQLMQKNDLITHTTKVEHMLWALYFLKVYPYEGEGASKADCYEQKWRERTKAFIHAMSWLELEVVSYHILTLSFNIRLTLYLIVP